MKRTLRCFVLLHLFNAIGLAQVWTNLGPMPLAPLLDPTNSRNFYSGRLSSIAVDPNDLNHWLIGAGNGGVWESRDAGTNWIPLSDAWPTLSIGAIAFAPSDAKTIYVGTGEPDPGAGGGFGQTGLGIFKSIDGGRTWINLAAPKFARATVKRIRIHPSNPNILVAGTSRGGYGRDSQEGVPSSPPFGVLKSTDGGASWIRTLNGQITALEVDPNNFNNQYAAIGDQRVENPNLVDIDSPDRAPNGIYRSVDGGQTWTVVPGPWGASTTTSSTVGRIELASAPSNPNVLYASIQVPPHGGGSGTGLLGLYRTDNAWAPAPSWIRIPTEATGQTGYCGTGKCGYSHVISVDPTDPNTVFAGGGDYPRFWRCTNCNASPAWTDLAQNTGVHPDYHATAWAGNRLIVGNDGGVFSTVDRGATWQSHNSRISTGMFYSGSLHPTNADFILGGLRDFQLSLRTSGNTWLIFPQPAPNREWGEAEVALSTSRPDTNWAANWCCSGVISRTTDGGKTSIQADAGIDKTGIAFVAPLRKCPANDDVFLTGSSRVWRTDNFFSSPAPSWTANAPMLTVPPGAPWIFTSSAPLAVLTIEFFAADTTCNTYVYGNRTGQIRLTRNGGSSWSDLDPGKTLPLRPVNGLAFDPTNPDVVYVVMSSFNDGTPGKPGHVFKTTNALAASPIWTNISPPDDLPYNVVRVDPRNANAVFAGTDAGLWYSANGGAGWQRFGANTGLPHAPIYDLQINPLNGQIVAFTYGRGAFKLDQAAVPTAGPILAIPTTSSLFGGATGAVYSQALSAGGGTAPYRWSVISGALPGGLTLSATGIISGTPTAAGVFTFNVMVTDAAAGVVTRTYTLTIAPAAALTRAGVMAQVACGGGWLTQIVLNNPSASAVSVEIVLRAGDGSLLNAPMTAVMQGTTQTATGATFTGTINPNATLLVTMENQPGVTLVGWADVLATGPLGGFAIFRYVDPNGKTSEGTSSMQTQFPAKFIAPYDNTSGFGTGIAIANVSANGLTVTATISDQDGASLGVQSFTLAANSHTSFFFPEKFSTTTGRQGIVTFQASGSPGLAALELRFSPFGTFTSVPTTPAQ